MKHDTSATSRLATNGYLRSIAVEESDVALYPLQGEMLIKDSSVHDTVSEDLIRRQEPECTQLKDCQAVDSACSGCSTYSILDGNSNKIIVVRTNYAAHILSPTTSTVSTTVNPDKNGQWPRGISRRVHIQEQAVFTSQCFVGCLGWCIFTLRAGWCVSIGLEDRATV